MIALPTCKAIINLALPSCGSRFNITYLVLYTTKNVNNIIFFVIFTLILCI